MIADVLAEKSIKFIEDNKNKPFFLYLATHDIHVPRVPNSRFRGTSRPASAETLFTRSTGRLAASWTPSIASSLRTIPW